MTLEQLERGNKLKEMSEFYFALGSKIRQKSGEGHFMKVVREIFESIPSEFQEQTLKEIECYFNQKIAELRKEFEQL